jgi:hypothetical protein
MSATRSGRRDSFPLRLLYDKSEAESVITLDSDSLKGGGVEPWLRRKHVKKCASPPNVRIGIARVNYGPVPNDIVGDNDGAQVREAKCPFKVRRVVPLVGIDEDEVEQTDAFRRNRASDSSAGPLRTSTTELSPARAMLDEATSACFGSASRVMSFPSGDSALASQIVLYPPSVPISRIRFAPWMRARR